MRPTAACKYHRMACLLATINVHGNDVFSAKPKAYQRGDAAASNRADSGSAEASYYTWVDQFDILGLGRNVPIATGNASDSLHVLVDGKFVELRVPYPMGFTAKGLDGRIDDPVAGWKGRGIWSTYAGRVPFHIEGGKGTRSKVVKFQLRPDPLAR